MTTRNSLKEKITRSLRSATAYSSHRKRSKEAHLLKCLKRMPDVRVELVEETSRGRLASLADMSADEMVSLLALSAARKPFAEVIQAMMHQYQDAWSGEFDAKFFHALQRMSDNFFRCGIDQTAGDLLKIGEIAAKAYNFPEWGKCFRAQIDRRATDRIRDLPFYKQRGW